MFRCDRGHIYCGKECSSQARRENLRAANRRYQRSFPGRLANAERQSRYRARRAEAAPSPESKNVTDHRSPVGNGLRIRSGDGRFASAAAAETLEMPVLRSSVRQTSAVRRSLAPAEP